MRASQIARIDASTPRWPVARVALSDQPSLELSGIRTLLDPGDPQHAAYTQLLDEARRRGHDLRMEVRNADQSVDRFIVRTDGTLIRLDHAVRARSAGAPPPSTARGGASPAGKPSKSRASALDRRRRPLVWGGAIMGVLVVASVVVLIVNPKRGSDDSATPTDVAPVPPTGTLYTEQPPPGWSPEAAWVLPIAKNSTPAVDADTGTVAVLTPDDRTSEATADDTAGDLDGRKPNYLSVLGQDGHTKFAVPLDSTPSAGPAITTIDGKRVVALVAGTTLSYWPLDGPAEKQVDIDLTAKNAAGVSLGEHGVLVEVSDSKLATIRDGGEKEFAALPLTKPIAMTADGALSVEEDTGTWWLTAPGEDPKKIAPAAPPGAVAYSSTVCADPEHVVVLWQSDAPSEASYKKPGILAGYDTLTGELVATAVVDSLAENKTASCPYSPVSGLTAGNGFMLLDAGAQSSLTLVPGLHPEAAIDAVYGTVSGDRVHIAADGTTTPQPESALIPAAGTQDQLFVISQAQLYALKQE